VRRGTDPPLGRGLYTALGGIRGLVVHRGGTGVVQEVVQGVVQIVQCRSNSYRGRMVMLEEYFESSSTLQRNERVKLAAMFWNIVGAGMLIGGVAGAFFFEGPLFWGKVGIAVVGIVLALIFQRVGDRILGYLRAP
jgi:hypothetical protein